MKLNKWIGLCIAVVLVGVLFMTTQVGSQKIEITEDIPSEEVQSIDIKNDSWDLVVKESNDNQVHVDIQGKQKNKKKAPVRVMHQDKQLIIQQDQQMGGAFSAFTFEKEGTITVSIPPNTIEQVKLVNQEGDLHIQALATRKIVVENEAGNVKFNEVKADVGVFNFIAGDFTVNNSSIDKLSVVAKGTNLYLKNMTSSLLNVYSKTGEIVLTGVDGQSEMNMETETGDIQVAYQAAPSNLKVAVENAKGEIAVNLANLATTTNTDEEVNGTIGAGAYLLHVKSYSGSIGIK
ncbi:hypothetical protein BVG16_01210 [Paenibacillus selenitireducens]|uniref:DUF4097 domain-containing protein n=1 Tax=Paenibacillus selenitireducens TaxID=1324314 RepID=A0A1T2XMF8_9BACL|nr:DUF4097 family beta strand repeat-containing protein [Paenibacillus selenitireducens]OPA80995.1 hypothetical protein BVG16_01210 [Paenibacillus selenitireducens]